VQPPDQFAGMVARHRFVWLFATLLVFFLIAPVDQQLRAAGHAGLPPILEPALFVILLVAVVVSISRSRAWKSFTVALALPAAVLWVLHRALASDHLEITRHLFLVAFLGYAIARILHVIFATRQVTFNILCASLCVYLLLGVVWALAYSVMATLDPGAFRSTLHGGEPIVLHFRPGRAADVLYFSFTTMTTVAYGDIVPASPVTRVLACLEALGGQFYLTVLVARLVGLHITHAQERAHVEQPSN